MEVSIERLPVKKGVLKHADGRKADTFDEKKPKKRVGIDESEALRVKKQLASGVHFSAKDLPAKIIKSKSNKNLFQEVKVVDSTKYNFRPRNQKQGASVKISEKDPNMMPKNDQLILIKRIQKYIPNNDQKGYQYRLKHLEWQNVAFKDYTINQCKQIWSELSKKVRRGRLPHEISSDINKRMKSNRKNSTKKVAFTKYITETFKKLPMIKKLKHHMMALDVRVNGGRKSFPDG
ncbi:unnamed protein product [Ceutorhynchus assimilis]|uniref:Uncharacterized protein n=1 Tax=Ceutorhynchus assimilis TaxID=467358 RepID=A0A9N9MEF4_9CUCU|nr:unnamed protein product [Ceutorhynchus assimilis]